MATQTETKKWYQSANFWTAIVLAAGGIFVGFPESDARNIVAALFGLISGGMLIREKLKGLKSDWKTWLRSANTWNYIATAVVAVVPSIPAELFTALRNLADAALGGNWQGVAAAAFSIATILYYLLRPKTPTAALKA